VIRDAIARLRRDTGLPIDPTRRGPVLLHRFFEEADLTHVAFGGLSCGRVTEHLRANRLTVESVGEPADPLAGFLFWSGEVGLAFVNADDILPRRRFTAAHELGHAVLHRDRMGRFLADTDRTLSESDEATDEREREANRFAAELLMPEEVCRARAEELRRAHGACPRGVLEYRLAAELLVSGQAIRYRLDALGVGDE
jgi:Zn-dependent peptidase ImmA (M78 family)